MNLRGIIAVNAVLVTLFVLSSYSIWNLVNNDYSNHKTLINPFYVETIYGNNVISVDPGGFIPNFPFWLFFVALAVNLYFIYRLSKQQPLTKNWLWSVSKEFKN
jgi:hypothetical protein